MTTPINPAADLRRQPLEVLAQLQAAGVYYGPTHPQVIASLAGDSTTGPPSTLEPWPREIGGGRDRPDITVDRYDLRPGTTYMRQISGGKATYGMPEPSMFAFGRDLPLATGSGLPPSILAWIPWVIRYTAYYADRASDVCWLLEQGFGPFVTTQDLLDQQSGRGQDALASYFSRIKEWALSRPADDPISPEEIDAMHSPVPEPKAPAKGRR
jgi:hypothetical protein